MPKSKNPIFVDEKIQKAYKNLKLSSKNIPEWFGYKTGEPTDFHEKVVIIQRNLMFPKKSWFQTYLKGVWYTLMYFFLHSEFILSSLRHIGTKAHH